MGLGVLEDKHLKHVPGTATLEELEGRQHIPVNSNAKRTKDGIFLEPQPSDDPEDPLNWPLWQRDLITFMLCLLSVMASTLSPLLAANTITLIEYFGIGNQKAALLTGWHLLGVGVSGWFFVATARVWGKRHLFILATIVIIASSIWGGCSGHSYKSLAAARFFQGVALAPFEGLVNAAVGEMYFVHESGKRMAFSNLCLFGGAFFTPVIVGVTTKGIGWQWTFWLVAIFTAAVLPFVYLLCSETTFNRHTHTADSTESLVQEDGTKTWELDPQRSQTVESLESGKNTYSDSLNQIELAQTPDKHHKVPANLIYESVQRKLITRKSLRLFSGRKSNVPFWKLAVRPFACYLYPSFLWAVITQGALIAWVSVLGVSLAIIMLGLGFNEAETGYMYSGAFIGAIGAFILAGLISDPLVKYMTLKNNGIFEPEFRLVLVIPMSALGLAGLFGFGVIGADVDRYGWLPVDVMFGFVVAGMTLGAVVSAQYIVDAHRDLAVEGFTCMLIFKNLIAFAVVSKGLDWLLLVGTKDLLWYLGYVQVGICATSIPMYILGKKNRSLIARYDILQLLRLSETRRANLLARRPDE